MLIAGEASGDTLAAELVRALRAAPEVQALEWPPQFFGAGGPQMKEAGVGLAFDLTEHAVVGFGEVLQGYFKFRAFFRRLLQLAAERQPDVVVLVDFSGFNRRFAAALRRRARGRAGPFHNWQPKIVYYVSPQVWASRPGRAFALARDVDLLLSVIPFEKEWYAARVPGLRVEFVGHPLIDRYADFAGGADRVKRRPGLPLVVVLPGSRRGELDGHLPVMLPAAQQIAARGPAWIRLVLPNAALAARARDFARTCLPEVEIQAGGLAESLAEAELVIASTGTVTLECAFFGVPTVAIYKTSWLTYHVAKQIIHVKFLAMPNLLAGEAIYPEFLQNTATADNIAREALDLLNDPKRRAAVKAKLAKVVASLGPPGASARAAKAVLRLCGLTPKTVRTEV